MRFPAQVDETYPVSAVDADGKLWVFDDLLSEGQRVGGWVPGLGRVVRRDGGLWIDADPEADREHLAAFSTSRLPGPVGPDGKRETPVSPRGRQFLVRLRAEAHTCGYAVGVHGSEARDLDLVAVPWTPEATSASELVGHLCEAMPLVEYEDNRYPSGMVTPNPEPKAWGRWAWSLGGCPPDWRYVDLSVAPRSGDPVPLLNVHDLSTSREDGTDAS